MTFRCPWRIAAVLAVLAVLALAAAARAEVKDAAELLPAQTLACVEVRQPERLAREISALVKGSELDDMPAVMARFREKLGDNMPFYFFNEAAVMSLLFSPEMINECGRVQGGVFAVTGVNKDGPEVVGVVLAGDSNLPTFYLRAMLTADFNVRSVAEVEGVRIYRERRQIYHPALPGQPPPMPTWEDSGPFMALLPSTVVLGSSAQGVKDVIVRFKGKSSEPSLASVASYKAAAKQRDKPGLFAYTDLAALAQRMDEAGKDLGPMEREWRVVKAAVNPKAVRGAVASLTLQNGVVELKARVDLDPKESSPLVELLTAKPASPDLLHFTPRDGLLTLSLNLNDGEKRCGKLMELIDSLDKPEAGEAERPAPSKMLKELEDRVKLNVAKDVLGRLTGAAVVLDAPVTTTMSYMEAPRPGGPPPVAHTTEVESLPFGRPSLLVLQATDADAAKYLEEQGVPKLAGLGTGEASAPIRQDVEGRSISTVAAGGMESLFGAKDLYMGREGAFLVIGPDRKAVVAALAAGAKKAGLLGEEKTAAAVKNLEDPLAVGVFSLGKGIVEIFKAVERPIAAPRPAIGPVPPPLPPAPGDKPPEAPKMTKRAEKTIEDAAKAVEPLPPTVLSLGRTPGELTLDIKQTGLKGVSAKVIDLLINSSLDRVVEMQGPRP